MLIRQIRNKRLPEPVTEYRFHPERKWRFDLAWPEFAFYFEVDGQVYGATKRINGKVFVEAGRHTRGPGYDEDARKFSEAILLGWSGHRMSTVAVDRGEAIDFLVRYFEERAEANAIRSNHPPIFQTQ